MRSDWADEGGDWFHVASVPDDAANDHDDAGSDRDDAGSDRDDAGTEWLGVRSDTNNVLIDLWRKK